MGISRRIPPNHEERLLRIFSLARSRASRSSVTPNPGASATHTNSLTGFNCPFTTSDPHSRAEAVNCRRLCGCGRSLAFCMLYLYHFGKMNRRTAEIKCGGKLDRRRFEDRWLTLYPSPYRWLGGNVTGSPQSPEEARKKKV